jgi:DNA processing protein
MTPLGRLLQLTLYGLKLQNLDTLLFFGDEPGTWKELESRMDPSVRQHLTKHQSWCQKCWQKLDDWTKNHELKWTYPLSPDYPHRLLTLTKPPLILCYRGRPIWQELELLAVVGSREPSRDSIDWMRQHLLGFLNDVEVAVASGGARGVDRQAHELTILAGRPTVAFLPAGILQTYPSNHRDLFAEIVNQGGAVISGFAPDAKMQKSFFHARNRWIAGIASVTFIVEAQRKSGTHLTAKMALEENRSICTLPVSPLAGKGLANLDLLYEGAQMIRDKNDLMLFFGRELRMSALAPPERQ